MKKIFPLFVYFFVIIFSFFWNMANAQALRYDKTIQQTITSEWVRSTAWELSEYNAWLRIWYWVNATNTFVLKLAKNIIIPIIIFVWILLAILWFYKIFFEEWEDASKTWFKYIMRWSIWIIIMVSAQYLTNILRWDILMQWTNNNPNWIVMSRQIYQNMIYPFLKIWFYIWMWVIFAMLIFSVFKFVQEDESTNSSNTFNTIIWWVVWILIIIWWKQLVEAVYGKQDRILNENVMNLGDIWQWILATKNIPIIYEIIRWIMSLASFIVLVILIYLWFLMLTDPENDESIGKIKNNILYVVIWILIIWAWYLITNFLIVT